MTVKEAYLLGREHLTASGSMEPAVEAEMLLRFVLGVDRARLYTHWDGAMPEVSWARYQSLLEERAGGRPVHYIVGEREFMGLAFAVDERVMIPRPETELLVEFAATRLRDRARPVIVDVGTGSGCIAVSLAHLLPGARGYATDLSSSALDVAAANAARHRVADRVTVLQGDLLDPLPAELRGRVDAVLSNPPYVPEDRAPEFPREIRDFEPREAILAAGDGTGYHRRLAVSAPVWLGPDGMLAMEVGLGQAPAVVRMLGESGRYASVGVERDGAGIGRVVWGVAEK